MLSTITAGAAAEPADFLQAPAATARKRCDFTSSSGATERCFGGVGIQCAGVLGAPSKKNKKSCTADAWVSAGSILHDRCCLTSGNNGVACAHPTTEECQEEWDEAFANTTCSLLFGEDAPRQWPYTFGPYPIGNSGDDVSDATRDLRAPPGVRVKPKYQALCSAGHCEMNRKGKVRKNFDMCGTYCTCATCAIEGDWVATFSASTCNCSGTNCANAWGGEESFSFESKKFGNRFVGTSPPYPDGRTANITVTKLASDGSLSGTWRIPGYYPNACGAGAGPFIEGSFTGTLADSCDSMTLEFFGTDWWYNSHENTCDFACYAATSGTITAIRIPADAGVAQEHRSDELSVRGGATGETRLSER